jgi:hypothetical protein
MMQLFVGNNVALGSAPMQAFVTGMHSAFIVSTVLVVIAAAISFVRGTENRSALTEETARSISDSII